MKKFLMFLALSFFLLSGASAQLLASSSIPIAGIREVDDGEQGSVANLTVEVHNGSGRVFLDTLPLTEVDTQASARLARDVACAALLLDCSYYDFFYIIRSQTPMIGGPSAGSAIAVVTMSALSNKSIKRGVAMSGTINPDGTIGPVGSIVKKAEVVHELGFDVFVVPPHQGVYDDSLNQLNLSDYARENWNLSIIEAEDVEYAFELATGFRIERPKANYSDVVNEVYTVIIESMAWQLRNQTSELLDDLKNESDAASMSVKLQLAGAILQASKGLEEVDSLISSGEFYVAASKSLQASIAARQAILLARYDKAEQKKPFVKSQIDIISSGVSSWEQSSSKQLVLDSRYDVELVVSGLDRLEDAKGLVDSAYQKYYSGEYQAALSDVAFATERLKTADTWYYANENVNGSELIVFNSSKLYGLASDRFSQADSAVTYASTIVSELESSVLLSELDSLRGIFSTGFYVRAIFKSLQLRGDANLIMEVRGLDLDGLGSLYERKRQSALRAINREREKGWLPILSISYLTFADEFSKSGDMVNALRYINYAYQYSGLSSDMIGVLNGDKYPLIEHEVSIVPVKAEGVIFKSLNPAYFTIGLIVGILFMLFLDR